MLTLIFADYDTMDGNVTPEYIDEPAYVDNGHYINVPPDMLEQNGGRPLIHLQVATRV